MNVSYSWLIDLLPELPAKIGYDPRALEPIMAMLGTGIETVIHLPAPADGVIFGVLRSCVAIPETHLFQLMVDVGDNVLRSIVTGAGNARVGIGVAVAQPGSVIQGVTVSLRFVQGFESWGMVCSPKELGIGEYGGGLLELPASEAPCGTQFSSIWPADTVLDVEITPNRADALSMLGIARDLAAYLQLELKLPSLGLQSVHDANFPVKIQILESESCQRFTTRMIKGARVTSSPAWLQRRIMNAGMRAINNLVDASNYVMLELGQPTAAYDAADLPNLIMTVRSADNNETVLTLDDQNKSLTLNDLLITTSVNGESRIIGIAGVMGANYSAISESTTDVILESAHFEAVRLRLTARRLGLASDAVYRFERGVDPNLSVWAADRYMEIVQKTSGGEVVTGHRYVSQEKPKAVIEFRPAHANDFLGTNYNPMDMKSAFERLGFHLEHTHLDIWTVHAPTWRVNMDLEEDLIEEVARILGYDAIPETIPAFTVNPFTKAADAPARATRSVKDVFVGLGFQEIVSYTFTNLEESARARVPLPELTLRNPQSSERTHLRTNLVTSLLNAARVNRGVESLMLFEVGRVFPNAKPEQEHLGLLFSGSLAPKSWQASIDGGFYAFKALLEAAAVKLGDDFEIRVLEQIPNFLHPGIAGQILWNGIEVGVIGAVHPQVTTDFELSPSFIAELILPLPNHDWAFVDPSRQPAALRDLAIVAPKTVPYSALRELAQSAAGEFLEDIQPFDVFSGGKIADGSRSVAVRLTFRAQNRTLMDEEVNVAFQNVIAAVKGQGFEIRDR